MKLRYTAGVLTETRHLYYSSDWRALEERLGASAVAERQCVWGQRYVDDLLLRDRDTNADGTLDERLYALQDPNWNMTGVADSGGLVQERYAYDAYGVPISKELLNLAGRDVALGSIHRRRLATGACRRGVRSGGQPGGRGWGTGPVAAATGKQSGAQEPRAPCDAPVPPEHRCRPSVSAPRSVDLNANHSYSQSQT